MAIVSILEMGAARESGRVFQRYWVVEAVLAPDRRLFEELLVGFDLGNESARFEVVARLVAAMIVDAGFAFLVLGQGLAAAAAIAVIVAVDLADQFLDHGDEARLIVGHGFSSRERCFAAP
jgi:hypothetical protein